MDVVPARAAVIFPEADTTAVEHFRGRWDPLSQTILRTGNLTYRVPWWIWQVARVELGNNSRRT
jgi:hypothetical protein